ncbi:hypothetical protein COOONC_22447 [Cooperia oncophora]
MFSMEFRSSSTEAAEVQNTFDYEGCHDEARNTDATRRRGSFAPPIFLPRSTNTGFQKDARGPAGPPSPPLTPPSRFLNRSPPSIMPLNRSPPSISPNNQQNIPFQRTNERPIGPTPPTTLPPRTTKHIPRPPSAVPPNFGPPGMTPFMFHEGRLVERNV